MASFLLREVRPADLEALEQLAERLNTLNLPADRAKLKGIIEWSRSSFGGRVEAIEEREYVFVLKDLDANRVVGTSMIIAQHGTYIRPAVYFSVRQEQKYSHTLGRLFDHQVLQLTFNYNGPTEIGGLVLDPAYRGHSAKLGKLLSFVRFLYMGMHREWFKSKIVAELLPPLNADGTSDLWDCLGANFTGLDYMSADRMSRENIEFVRSLFPVTPIYTALLPEHVREKIGCVGPQTKPVEKMLTAIGFRYDHSIDPFDGGPTFIAEADLCEPIRRTRWSTYAGVLDRSESADGLALLGYEYQSHLVRFRAVPGEYQQKGDRIWFRSSNLDKMSIEPGDRCGFLPLRGPSLKSLY